MNETVGWARVWAAIRPNRAPTLRRGAWYRVLEEKPSTVVLGVDDKRIAVPRRLLEIRPKNPARFSVVHKMDTDPNPVRGTTHDVGRMYAVCPNDRARVPLFGQPEILQCPACGYKGVIAWWETT
jgi:hypothetical protein